MIQGSRISRFISRSYSRDTAILLLRLWLGSVLIMHGSGKIFGRMEAFTHGVADMGFPLPDLFAWMAALSEFGGGILLILGLFTRPAALFISATMFTAGFIHHAHDPFGRKELSLTFLVVALAILIAGPGKRSLDRLIFGRRG